MSYIEDLKEAIRHTHGCEADHVETVPVTEMFQGEVAWDGEVEVFDLHDHRLAKRCYAWGYDTENGKRFLAVLELPPVTSPKTAVMAAIRSDAGNE